MSQNKALGWGGFWEGTHRWYFTGKSVFLIYQYTFWNIINTINCIFAESLFFRLCRLYIESGRLERRWAGMRWPPTTTPCQLYFFCHHQHHDGDKRKKLLQNRSRGHALGRLLVGAEIIFVKKFTRPQFWALKIYAKQRRKSQQKRIRDKIA